MLERADESGTAPSEQSGPAEAEAEAEVPAADAPAQDDYCRNFRPENGRGFFNTEKLFR